MRKIISFMHISLDGFVAGPNGEMDWIKINEEIFSHVGNRINKGDMALYGRVTFQMMENYWPTAGNKPSATKHDIDHSKWYAKIQKVVLSRSLKEKDFTNTKIISDNLTEKLSQIKQGEGEDILLFGSPSATHSLIKLDLIDGYWLFVNPVLLGKGIPLFVNVNNRTKLKLLSAQQFNCGVNELNYILEK
ncbi:MAG: dihydrofolate reductase family protein [Ignavibacteriae bacterium]|nr:dihydrofolate reductase family protein [Ignavibacteriota bacterium]